MQNLSKINRGGPPVIDSRDIAEMTGKQHKNLLRDIDSYVEILEKSESSNLSNGLTMRVSDFFIPGEYEAGSPPRKYRNYYCTRKGCDMVANKMTGEKGVLFTAAYITKFEDLENKLKALSSNNPQDLPEAFKAAINLFNLNAQYLPQEMRNAAFSDLWKKLAGTDLPVNTTLVPVVSMSPIKVQDPVMAFPQGKENGTSTKWYSTTDIADMGGVSKQLVACLASKHGLRTEQYSRLRLIRLNGIRSPRTSGLAILSYNELGKETLLRLIARRKEAMTT